MARCGCPLMAMVMMETVVPNDEPKTNAGLDEPEKFKKNRIHTPEPLRAAHSRLEVGGQRKCVLRTMKTAPSSPKT